MAQLLDIAGLKDRTSPEFRSALVQLAAQYDLDPSVLAAVMRVESNFNPHIQNRKGAPALGLIQFWKSFFTNLSDAADTLFPEYTRKGRTWDDLRAMNAIEQLPYVLAYFLGRGLTRKSAPGDYYVTTVLPAFVGYPDDKVVGQKGSTDPLVTKSGNETGITLGKFYEQNDSFDTDRDGVIVVGDIRKRIESVVGAAKSRPALEVELLPLDQSFGRLSVLPDPATSASSPSASAPTSSSAPAPGVAELPVLGLGSKGPAVQLWQRILNHLLERKHAPLLDVDSDFGVRTVTATKICFGTSRVTADVWQKVRL